MPGINRGVWGAEAGRDGRTLTLKEALPAGLCLRSALDFTPRKSSRDFPPLPTGGCPGGGSRPRSADSPGSLRAAPRTPAGLPLRSLSSPVAYRKKSPKPRRGQSRRRCSGRRPPSRGNGPDPALCQRAPRPRGPSAARPRGLSPAEAGISRSPGRCAARRSREQPRKVPRPQAAGERGAAPASLFIFLDAS